MRGKGSELTEEQLATITKKCIKCEKEKPLNKFNKNWNAKYGRDTKCGECASKHTCKWQKENLEKSRKKQQKYNITEKSKRYRRDWELKKKFGISIEEYEEIFKKQNYQCLICGDKNEEQDKKKWNLDHCHETGKIRGILCGCCNRGLGQFKDKLELLIKAVEYLRKAKCE